MGKGFSVDIKKKKCVTPVCRGSYVNILEPRAFEEGDTPEYGLQALFPKDDPNVAAWMKELNAVLGQVLIDKFGKDKAMEMAPLVKKPFRDGDHPQEADKDLKGFFFMNVKNKFRQPHILGPMGKPIDPKDVGPDDIYSGAWYRLMLEFWYYAVKGNKGISASVAAIMKIKDDENLGSGTSKGEAADAMGEFAEEAATMFEADTADSEADAKKDAEGFNFMSEDIPF